MKQRPEGCGRLAWTLATWFGCGLAPKAPGTVGTIGALPLYFVVRAWGPFAIAGAALLLTAVGIWASGAVARSSRLHDPQVVVIDEVAGVLVALAVAPPTWAGVVLAVVAFRLFDITKPFPVRRFERLPGGWGIVLDDVVAGALAAGLVFAVRHLAAAHGVGALQ